MNHKQFLRGSLIVGLLAGTALAADPIQVEIQPSNKRTPSPVRPIGRAEDQARQLGRPLNLSGSLDVDKSGVSLNGRPLLMTARTVILPAPKQKKAFDLKSLDGEAATVLGRLTPDGVEVTLVVLRDRMPIATPTQPDFAKAYIVANEKDSGYLKPGAPH